MLDCPLVERGEPEKQSWRSQSNRVPQERRHIQSGKPQPITAGSIIKTGGKHACEVHASTRNRRCHWKTKTGHLFQEVALAVVFFGLIGLARTTGHWQTNVSREIYINLVPNADRYDH